MRTRKQLREELQYYTTENYYTPDGSLLLLKLQSRELLADIREQAVLQTQLLKELVAKDLIAKK